MSSMLESVKNDMKHTKHLSKSLQNVRVERVPFDPTNLEHRAAYLLFSRTGAWAINFQLESPYVTVVQMAQDKLMKSYLENDITEKAAAKLQVKYEAARAPAKLVEEEKSAIKVTVEPLIYKVA